MVQGFFTPLQDESETTAASTAKTRHFLEFMQTPHDGFGRQPRRLCAAGIPQQHSIPVDRLEGTENLKLPKY
jgi:hypothetical protein